MLGSERQRGRVEGDGRTGEIAADVFVEGKHVLFRNGPLHIWDKGGRSGTAGMWVEDATFGHIGGLRKTDRCEKVDGLGLQYGFLGEEVVSGQPV